MLIVACVGRIGLGLFIACACLALLGCGDDTAPTANDTPKVPPIITAGGQPQTDPLTAGEGTHLVVLDVEGMTCNACVRAINETVSKLPGVKNVSSNATDLKAWVVIEDGSATDAAAVATEISALGSGKLYKASVTH